MTFVPVTTLEEALAVALPGAGVQAEPVIDDAGVGGTAASAARGARE